MNPKLRGLSFRWSVASLALVAASLYFQAFLWPHIPIYQGSSSPIFMLDAVRMLHGETIYKDFFELTLPGAPVFYALMFKLFGIKIWISSATFLFLGVALVIAGWQISRAVLDGPMACLPALVFVAFGFTTERDPTHHWFSALAVLIALALLIRDRTPGRLAAAGACCGLATLFTQNTGVAAALGIALFLVLDGRKQKHQWGRIGREVAWLAGGALAIALPAALWLISLVSFKRLFYCTVLFPLRYFHDWYWNQPQAVLSEIPDFHSLLELPALAVWAAMYFIVSYGCLGAPISVWRRKSEPFDARDRSILLLAWTGLIELFGVAFSPSWLRVCSISFPALLILVWRIRRSRWARPGVGLLAAACVAMLIVQPLIVQTSPAGVLRLPAGTAAFLNRHRYEKERWLASRSTPGEFIFEASDSDLYFPLMLQDPATVSFITATRYTRPGQIRAVVDALESGKVQYVLWSVWLDVPLHTPDASFDAALLAPVRACLRQRYHLAGAFGPNDYEQVWKLNAPTMAAKAVPGPSPRR